MRSVIRFRNLAGIAAALITAAAASSSPIRAENFATDVPDLVWIDVGGAINEVNTDMSLTGPRGVGVAVNFEDVLDLPGSKTTGRMFGTARISAKRRYIDFGYVDIDRSGSKVISEDLNWGDYTFLADGQVDAGFRTQFMYAAFRYDFLHEEKVRISGSAGLTFIRIKASVAGLASYPDPNDPNVTITSDIDKESSANAPVPMVGLNLDWALTRRLTLRTYNRFFRLNMSGFNGGLYEAGVRLNWYFVKHFGMGLGFDRTALNIKNLDVGAQNNLKANYGFSGVGLYFNLAF